MTSYADDNRFVFASRSRKTPKKNTAESIRRREEPTRAARPAHVTEAVRTVPQSNTPSVADELLLAVKRCRKAQEHRDRKRASENEKIIRKAFAKGVKKVSYNYEDYAVEEHNFPISFAAVTAALTLIAVFLLLNYSQITKFNNDMSDLKTDMARDNAEIAQYDILIGKKTDHASIEQYAYDHGLVSSDKVISRYVTMSDNYKIEKTDGTASEDGYTVSTVMSGVVRLFGEALGN